MDIKAKLTKLVMGGLDGLELHDHLAGKYLGFHEIATIADREAKETKEGILSSFQSVVSRVSKRVEKSEVSESTSLNRGDRFLLGAKINIGASYVDMETLRLQLGISKEKWEIAVQMAKSRRSPTISIDVTRI